MIDMIEEQAKTKVCPLMSEGLHSLHSGRREGAAMRVMCIASDCMMWVKAVRENRDGAFTTIELDNDRGSCGLLAK